MTSTAAAPPGPSPESPGEDMCQLQAVIQSSPRAPRNEEAGLSPVTRLNRALHRVLSLTTQKKIRRIIGSALNLGPRRRRAEVPAADPPDAGRPGRLEAGDLVLVRSRAEIEATLDRRRQLRGCRFLSEMATYCGTSQKVLKRVERFMDERDYRLKKANGVVLLEGVMCSRASATERCDRSCLFFWREEWLEKQA